MNNPPANTADLTYLSLRRLRFAQELLRRLAGHEITGTVGEGDVERVGIAILHTQVEVPVYGILQRVQISISPSENAFHRAWHIPVFRQALLPSLSHVDFRLRARWAEETQLTVLECISHPGVVLCTTLEMVILS